MASVTLSKPITENEREVETLGWEERVAEGDGEGECVGAVSETGEVRSGVCLWSSVWDRWCLLEDNDREG